MKNEVHTLNELVMRPKMVCSRKLLAMTIAATLLPFLSNLHRFISFRWTQTQSNSISDRLFFSLALSALDFPEIEWMRWKKKKRQIKKSFFICQVFFLFCCCSRATQACVVNSTRNFYRRLNFCFSFFYKFNERKNNEHDDSFLRLSFSLSHFLFGRMKKCIFIRSLNLPPTIKYKI